MEPSTETQSRLCTLERTIGREVPCPAAACAFWEPGGAALPGGCAFERLDPAVGPDATRLLLEIRATLESGVPDAGQTELRRELYRLLNEDADTG